MEPRPPATVPDPDCPTGDPVLLRSVDWLAGAPREPLDDFARRCAVLRLARGTQLARPGEAPDRAWVLLQGRLGAWRGTPRLRGGVPEQGVAGPGLWYWVADRPGTTAGLEAVVSGLPVLADLRVMAEPTDVLAVPAPAVHDLLAAWPEGGLAVARHVAGRLQALTEQVVDLVVLDVPRRVANHLVRHRDGDVAVLPPSQGELAERLAASRQRVNRALSDLTRRGWIAPLGPGRYALVDLPALRDFGGVVDDPRRPRR